MDSARIRRFTRALAACFCAAGILGAVVESVEAAFPGANGRIVFGRDLHDGPGGMDNPEVWSMDADGGNQTWLTPTNDPKPDDDPAWSPDGTKIVFHSGRTGDQEIYVMDADGANVTNLTGSPETNDFSAAWSPDGATIAYVNGPKSLDPMAPVAYDIWVIDLDEGAASRWNFTADPAPHDFSPAWSPDGAKIAWHSDRAGNDEIFVAPADGSGSPQRLTHNSAHDGDPAWSPDGTKIAFHSDRGGDYQIFVMDLADGPAAGDSPAKDLSAMTGDSFSAAWSPDGARIAWHNRGNAGSDWDIYSMGPDGTDQVNLTATPDTGEFAPDWQTLAAGSPSGDAALSGATNATVTTGGDEASEPAAATPAIKIKRPRSGKRYRRNRLRKLYGTASSAAGVQAVEYKLVRRGKPAAAAGYRKAGGTSSWRVRLRKRLRHGRYRLYVRVTDGHGATARRRVGFTVV